MKRSVLLALLTQIAIRKDDTHSLIATATTGCGAEGMTGKKKPDWFFQPGFLIRLPARWIRQTENRSELH